jgi:5-formyltetrahydrofolate cyclo-ligase
MKDEVDIRPLLEEVLKLGHALYLPCFENALVFRKIHDLSTLTKGPFGFLQPPVTEPALAMSENVTVLVPGRAFTSDGHRLGRGNGGYDIWMRKKRQASPKSTYWGVCYDCQIVHDLPTEEHDERVTRVITARGIATIS